MSYKKLWEDFKNVEDSERKVGVMHLNAINFDENNKIVSIKEITSEFPHEKN